MLAKEAAVSVEDSHVSVIPRISIDFVATRSERAGAFSRLERAFTVPIWTLLRAGPGLTEMSPARSRRRVNQKLRVGLIRGRGNSFLLQQTWRTGRIFRLGDREESKENPVLSGGKGRNQSVEHSF